MSRTGNQRRNSTEREAFINRLLFETPGGLRFTVDNPVLPDVWAAFADQPHKQQELILTVGKNQSAGQAAQQLRSMLNELRLKRPKVFGLEYSEDQEDNKKQEMVRERARVSYIPGQLAVKLYFDELMRVVLPLTPWWGEILKSLQRLDEKYNSKVPDKGVWTGGFPHPDPTGKRNNDLADALMLMRREIDPSNNEIVADAVGDDQAVQASEPDKWYQKYIQEISPDLCWVIRAAGVIGDCFSTGNEILENEDSVSAMLNFDFESRDYDRIETSMERERRLEQKRVSKSNARAVRMELVEAFANLYKNWDQNNVHQSSGLVWRVSKNRRVHLAVNESKLTVKADAARRLFDISCKDITWAILDSGIDQAHSAFKQTDKDHEMEVRQKHSAGDEKYASEVAIDQLDSRVVKTLDFTRLRELLDFDIDGLRSSDESVSREERVLALIQQNLIGGRDEISQAAAKKKAKKILKDLRRRIKAGKDISWEDLEDALTVSSPKPPPNDHGTHVAGILGADWIEDIEAENTLPLELRTRRMRGVCPDIKMIDVRVFREDGLTDEFELLAAIQFLRWMNARAGASIVHGANLSLSLVHKVQRFACGQTPICEECNEAVALGMVVVASAGNAGYEMQGLEASFADHYQSATITDPGNAQGVITVGATHRRRPHEYGVSYFSSRGPTGDGRLKPDLVAPGEKIKGPTPNGRAEFKDGTSMAAPHVSGAAAMLMARQSELIGKPEQIKKILCETATDLGREKYFQGAGLVDILRALQYREEK